MGLSSKHVSGDHQPGFEWVPQSELSKPPSTRRPHQQSEQHLKCPRCNSDNTKFCYYNNYNKSQPRHFCKSCKRHWTKGGTLRNVPVGGGRKNKRPKISKPATAAPPRQQELSEFPLSGNSSTGAQKSMTTTNILYQALLHETTKGFNTANSVSGLNATSPSEFHFSSLNTFDMNVSWDPACYQPLNAFDNYGGNLDSIEESTITTVNIPSSSSGPWAGPDISSTMDLPNYWNWSDIDVLNTADLNLSWDDEDDNADIKAQSKFQD